MFAKMTYGINHGVTATITPDTLTRLTGSTLQEALQDLLGQVSNDPDGTVPALREALQDPRSVIEVKDQEGYLPTDHHTPFNAVLMGRADLEILISKAHAGG